jgi:hypothetical protein
MTTAWAEEAGRKKEENMNQSQNSVLSYRPDAGISFK